MNALSPGNTRIKPAREIDLPALAQLASFIWRTYYPGIITTEQIEYMLAWMYSPETLRQELRSGVRFDLLLHEDAFVGFASYGAADEPSVVKLHKLYLDPEMHGRGFGRLLLNHCEKESCSLGARRLILNVNKRNEKAIKAYRRNDFQVIDSVVTDIGNGFAMDDYVMAKDLTSSPA